MKVERKRILVIGGARSGKSRFARVWCEAFSGKKVFMATCPPLDDEMKERIEKHQAERDGSWETVEASFQIGEGLKKIGPDVKAVLIDCLTLWLSNLSMRESQEKGAAGIRRELDALREEVVRFDRPLALVTGEVGMGIVPATSVGRNFRDWQGLANQEMARVADEVYLVTAGIPTRIK